MSKWRTGRKNGRILYEQRGPEPSDADKMIGSMDTAELAAQVVAAVNSHDCLEDVFAIVDKARITERQFYEWIIDRFGSREPRQIGFLKIAWFAAVEKLSCGIRKESADAE